MTYPRNRAKHGAATAVVSAFPAGRGDDAVALVFEYMAARPSWAGLAEERP